MKKEREKKKTGRGLILFLPHKRGIGGKGKAHRQFRVSKKKRRKKGKKEGRLPIIFSPLRHTKKGMGGRKEGRGEGPQQQIFIPPNRPRIKKKKGKENDGASDVVHQGMALGGKKWKKKGKKGGEGGLERLGPLP